MEQIRNIENPKSLNINNVLKNVHGIYNFWHIVYIVYDFLENLPSGIIQKIDYIK